MPKMSVREKRNILKETMDFENLIPLRQSY